MGLSGLEPPTSRLSGVRSNQLSYKPFCFRKFFIYSGSHLLSHTVSSAVPSAAWVLTIVFGMGTGVSPKRIATRNLCYFICSCRLSTRSIPLCFISREPRLLYIHLLPRTSVSKLPASSPAMSVHSHINNSTAKQPLLYSSIERR